MEKKTIKVLFVNGGPRKNKNTAQMLMSAMKAQRMLVQKWNWYISTTSTSRDVRVASPVS